MIHLKFGREVCSDRKIAQTREWLVTNGIGGYASGTIAGILTRRYHGLLVAALNPPVARTLLLTKLDETISYQDQTYELGANLWGDGTVSPQGFSNIESFQLVGTTPVWQFAFADGLLEKSIWMEPGENTTYIRYTYKRGSQPLSLSLKALVNYRDHHYKTTGKSPFIIQKSGKNRLEIQANPEATSLYLYPLISNLNQQFSWEIANTWYRDFKLSIENYRGLDHTEDHLLAAIGKVTLHPDECLTIVASTTEASQIKQTNLGNYQLEKKRSQQLIELFTTAQKPATNTTPTPEWIEQLVLAADQFIVNRPLPDNPQGKTIIAGYPWFTDWGRDTAIALPGLTIATGRYEVAKTILLTFAQYVDQGMLPNVFPDADAKPDYNTVDATLWYFETIRAYYFATKDREFLNQLFPILEKIIHWHIKGTRYQIKVADDGLLYAGEPGVQLTWMDAKVGDWVVTPRIGKPIEINALWYNALRCLSYFAGVLAQPNSQYRELAEAVRSHFQKFWSAEAGYCYDVIDTPTGNDASFRSNQIFAVSLPSLDLDLDSNESLLTSQQQKMVVDKVASRLLTSYGLRSLDPKHPDYVGIYGGNQLQRDGSYHQGTTWGWSIGHFVQAHLKVYQSPKLARSFLLPMADHLQAGCLGSISEIFDGDAPFTSRGCFAQAWSVAEILRAWLLTFNNN